MTALAGAEAMILALRVGFAVSLYLFVTVAILALRRAIASSGGAVAAVASARLVLLRVGSGGDEAGRAVTLTGAAMLIGRAPTNDIVVRDDGVSARHARLDADGGRWMLADVGSRNGTTLNGIAVTGPVHLTHGDEVGIGDLAWRYESSALERGGR